MTANKPVGGNGPESAVALSIIIATYNARDLVADCLESIYRNPPDNSYEIIVVDDASADDTCKVVRSRFPEVRLFANETNRHYAHSNNLAFDNARGQYLYLLNNDTIMLPQALDRMLQFLRQHPDVGVVGSQLLNEDGTIQWSVKTLPNAGSALFGARSIITRMFPNNPFSRKHLQHLGHDLSKPFVAGYVSSASMMMPREVVKKVGGLDERLSYHVDADYCKRITDLGYKCYYLPASKLVHLNHKGGTMVSRWRRFRSVIEFHRGSYIFFQKHMRTTVWSPMRIIVPVGLFARFVVCMVLQAITEFFSAARVRIGRIFSASTWRAASTSRSTAKSRSMGK